MDIKEMFFFFKNNLIDPPVCMDILPVKSIASNDECHKKASSSQLSISKSSEKNPTWLFPKSNMTYGFSSSPGIISHSPLPTLNFPLEGKLANLLASFVRPVFQTVIILLVTWLIKFLWHIDIVIIYKGPKFQQFQGVNPI